jgi:hypothetical protein
MNEELVEFEQYLKDLLNDPNPTPKYKLWQTVLYDRGSSSLSGRIVGFYFLSVGIAFQNAEGCDPGWYYHIESGLQQFREVHEDNIVLQIEEEMPS